MNYWLNRLCFAPDGGEGEGGSGWTPLTIGDTTYETEDDLEKAVLRQSDYTKKTEETAELRKELETALRGTTALTDILEKSKTDPDAARRDMEYLLGGVKEVEKKGGEIPAHLQSQFDDMQMDLSLIKLRSGKDGEVFSANENDIMRYCLDEGISNVGHGFKVWKGDNLDKLTKEAREDAVKKAEEGAKAQKLKDASSVTEGANGKSGGGKGNFKYDSSKDAGSQFESFVKARQEK